MRLRYNRVSYVPNSKPPIIRFHITVTNDGERARFFGFNGELSCYQESEYDVGNSSIILGNVYEPRSRVHDLPHDRSYDITLDYQLNPYVKDTIEKLREGDLKFKLYLTCYKQEMDAEGKISGFRNEQDHVYDSLHGAILSVPRSTWADILTQGGYGAYQIIELPIDYGEIISTASALSRIGFQDRLGKASEQLSTIMRYMDEGRWSLAVGESRKAFEALTKGSVNIDGQQKSAVAAICELLHNSGLPKKNAESFRLLIDNFKDYTQPQHHIQDSGEDIVLAVPVDREDALFTVTTLTTIINLLARKYRKST